MTSLETLSYEPRFQTLLHTLQDLIQDHRRLAWLAYTTISLLSTRYLLVEQNVHYPLRLYGNYIIATLIILLCRRLWQKNNKIPEEQHIKWRKRTLRRTLLMAGTKGLEALSLICTMQAVLHYTNLPVLLMLTTIAFLAESIVLVIAGIIPLSRVEILRLTLLIPCCAGMLIAEYRLDVPQLLSCILAMLFAGVASALRKLVLTQYPDEITARSEEHMWALGMGCLVNALWLLLPIPWDHVNMSDLKSIPLLAINAVFTAAAVLLGGSMVFPMDSYYNGQCPEVLNDKPQTDETILMVLALVGNIGCYSTLLSRRSYSCSFQLFCFLLAILCLCTKYMRSIAPYWLKRPLFATNWYELPSDRQSLRSNNTDDGAIDIEARCGLPQAGSASTRLRSSFIILGLVTLWIAYLCLNFTERQYAHVETYLDQTFQPELPQEVVLSMYNEPIEDVTLLITKLKHLPQLSDACFTIYLKAVAGDAELIKYQTGANKVIERPNIGREGETYLHHILSRWDSLAAQTIFLQANVHNPREFYARLEQYFLPNQTGFLSLGWPGNVCNCNDCGDRFSWRDDTHFFSSLQQHINSAATCRNVLLSYKGQFVVSAARIRGIDKNIYGDLWELFVDKESWTHQQKYLQGRPNSMSRPHFGYTMERVWNLLFQCSDMDVAWKCPSLLSGWRQGGDIGDCQCFDT